MKSLIKKAIFPIAGLGTRFLPATKSIPKEMLTILDRPVLEWAVLEASKSGIEEMIFVTSSNVLPVVAAQYCGYKGRTKSRLTCLLCKSLRALSIEGLP